MQGLAAKPVELAAQREPLERAEHMEDPGITALTADDDAAARVIQPFGRGRATIGSGPGFGQSPHDGSGRMLTEAASDTGGGWMVYTAGMARDRRPQEPRER
jgi:hypothetical protein